MGEKSGEYGASQITSAPHSAATSSMRLARWALRLSKTRMSPRRMVGPSTRSTQLPHHNRMSRLSARWKKPE